MLCNVVCDDVVTVEGFSAGIVSKSWLLLAVESLQIIFWVKCWIIVASEDQPWSVLVDVVCALVLYVWTEAKLIWEIRETFLLIKIMNILEIIF